MCCGDKASTDASRRARLRGRLHPSRLIVRSRGIQRCYRRNLGHSNRGRRPIFVVGEYIPLGDRGYFQPVLPSLLGYLAPPPPGYSVGYFDGYVVVYDPISLRS
jgi:hypothetical protein